ncbi:MAG: YDG domain-containing protein [Thermoguttaceae bacterium]
MSNAHRFRSRADHTRSISRDRRGRRQDSFHTRFAARRLRCERLEDRMLLSGDLKVAFEFFSHTATPPDPSTNTPLASLSAPGDYWLEAVVTDNRNNNGGTATGLQSAYFNIGLDTAFATPDITTYTPGPTFSDGGVTPSLSVGLISNIGATDSDLIAPTDPGDSFLLFSVECHVNSVSPLPAAVALSPQPATIPTAMVQFFGATSSVPWSSIDFSGASTAVNAGPTANIVAVTPNPRNSAVGVVTVNFSENVTGVNTNDFSLTRNGTPVSLSGLTVTQVAAAQYTLDLSTKTGSEGTYVLTLTAAGSGITDGSGNALVGDASDTWVTDTTPPTASIVAVTPDPRNSAVGTVTVNFSEDVSGVDINDFSLTRDGTTVSLAGLAVTPVTGSQYTLDLSTKTIPTGTYVLTLTAAGSGITDAAGNSLTQNASETWVTTTATPLTVTGITANNKVYDGTTVATLNLGSAILVGVASGDDVTLNTGSASGAFADRNVGAGKTVSIAGLTLSGADAGNYILVMPTATADITARAITVTAATDSKVYDGTPLAAAAPTITSGSLVSSDAAAFTETYDTKNVGTGKTLTPAGAVNDGNSGNNYALTFVPDNTGVITARSLTISATGINKQYDGTTAATVTLSDDRVASDNLSDSYTAAAFSDANAGTGKTVTVTGISISGADAGNYTLSNTTATTTANITPRAITVTAATNTKTYDGTTTATAAPTITSGSLVSSDTAAFTETYDTKNVGTGKTLTPAGSVNDGNGGNNYAVTFVPDDTGVITALAITVSAATNSKVYDGTTAAAALPTITSGSLASGDSAAFTEAYATKNVGTDKTLTPAGSVNDGNGGNNYTVTFVPDDTGVITTRTLTVSATGVNKEYDGTTTATVTLSDDRASGDNLTDNYTAAAFVDVNAGTGKTVNVTGISISGADAGNYTLSNTTATTTANITPRAITVMAATNSKVYDGTTTAAAVPTITSGSLVSSDTAAFTETYDTKNAGTGKTLTPAGSISDGNDGNNYAVTFVPDTTGVITALAITVTAATNSKVYDGTTAAAALPTITSGSLVSGDTAAFTETYDTKNVGTGKTLTPAGSVNDGNGGNNYAVTFVSDDTGVITALAITVTAAANNKVYDGTTTAGAVPTITSGSLAASDTAAFTETYDTKNVGTAKTLTPAGTVSDGNGGSNYTVTFVPGNTGVISARTLTVSAAAANKVYDGTTTATVTLSDDRVTGDIFTESYTAAAFSDANPGTGKTVTVTGISITGADAGNYVLSSTTATTTADITQLMNSAVVGFVYCDNDNDGVYSGHATVPHVTITLQYQDNGQWQNWTTNPYQQTNDSGWYGFSGLPAGTYRVILTQPAAFTAGGPKDPTTQTFSLASNAWQAENFGVGGLQPQYISRRLFLNSTPSMLQIVRDLNVPPVVDLNGAAAGTNTSTKFYGGGGPITIAAAGTISDSDSPTLASLTVTITNVYDGAAELLDANVAGTSISKSYANGVLTLTGIAPIADYIAVLDSVTYNDTATTLSAPTINRIVTFVANDGLASSTVATATISDPPAPSSPAQLASSPAVGVNLKQNIAAVSSMTTASTQAAPAQIAQESAVVASAAQVIPATSAPVANVAAATIAQSDPVVASVAESAPPPPAASPDLAQNAVEATPEPAAPSVVRNGSEVTVTGTAGDDTFEFVAGASENTVIVQGQSYVYAAAEVTAFHFVGGGGNDTAKLTATGLANLAETAQLQPGSATLQGVGYTVDVSDVQNVEIDGRGEGVQAALFASPGDDSLTAQGDVASLSGDGFVETVSGFQRVTASAVAGGHDTLRELAFDHLLETVGDWIEEV